MSRKHYSVAVFLVDRAYGGPEEGGWWYDYGIPSEDHAHLTRWTHNRKQADRATHKLEAQIAGDNEGRREISSVLSDGEYRVCITLGQPKPWPQHRPHYE
jgi:hypothetical protein